MERRTTGVLAILAALATAVAAQVGASIEGEKHDFEIKPAQIRCWQDGELIFAEDGWSPSGQMEADRVITLTSQDPDQGRLLVMDLQRATCVLKQR